MPKCDIKSRLVDTLKDDIKGKATSYKIHGDSVFIPFSKESEINTLKEANAAAKRIVEEVNKKYSPFTKT